MQKIFDIQQIIKGKPALGSQLFIGAYGADPVENPGMAWLDKDGSESILTPVLLGTDGRPLDNNGNPIELYADGAYSMQLVDPYGVHVFEAPWQVQNIGDPGQSATITVGTVTTLLPNQAATVTNTGTPTEAVFNFGIPQGQTGAKGDKGDQGEVGPEGPQGPQGNPTSIVEGDNISVDNTDPASPEISFDGSDGITIGTGTNAVDYGKAKTLPGLGSLPMHKYSVIYSVGGVPAELVTFSTAEYGVYYNNIALFDSANLGNNDHFVLALNMLSDISEVVNCGVTATSGKSVSGVVFARVEDSASDGGTTPGYNYYIDSAGHWYQRLGESTPKVGDATLGSSGDIKKDTVTRDYVDESVIDITSLVVLGEYTLQPQDHGKMLVYTGSGAIDLICPDELTIPTGDTGKFVCSVMQLGTGVISVVDDGTSTVTNPDGALYDTAGQYREIKLFTLNGSDYVLKGEAA